MKQLNEETLFENQAVMQTIWNILEAELAKQAQDENHAMSADTMEVILSLSEKHGIPFSTLDHALADITLSEEANMLFVEKQSQENLKVSHEIYQKSQIKPLLKEKIVTDDTMNTVLNCIRQHGISSLDLSQNRLSTEAFTLLNNFISENPDYFTNLNLSGEKTITSQQAQILANSIKANNDFLLEVQLRPKKTRKMLSRVQRKTGFDEARKTIKEKTLQNQASHDFRNADNYDEMMQEMMGDFMEIQMKP